jgi:hypothetical protein
LILVIVLHDNRQLRMTFDDAWEQLQAIAVRQLDVQQHEIDIEMLSELPPGRRGIPGFGVLG